MKISPFAHFMFGFFVAFMGMFFGYLWSPDYTEFVSNGYNFLGLAAVALIFIFLELVLKEKK